LLFLLVGMSRCNVSGASTKIKAEDGRDPLFSAVEKRNIEIVKILLDHGANPNSRYCTIAAFQSVFIFWIRRLFSLCHNET
jgi:ankyrin repeat protein